MNTGSSDVNRLRYNSAQNTITRKHTQFSPPLTLCEGRAELRIFIGSPSSAE